MRVFRLRHLVLSSVAVLGACAEGASGPTGPGVEINVAPLDLPSVAGVEYAVAVFNTNPNPGTLFNPDGTVADPTGLVWQQSSLTSNDFGNGGGGAISYVGPCDADESPNYVALVLKNVDVGDYNGSFDDGASAFPGNQNLLDDQNTAFSLAPGSNDLDADFQNPSPWDDPVVLSFPCEENEDTQVVFNLTIMRDADQGFFDVAVNFEDIFCSMKIDTCYDGQRPITLLFDDEGKRVATAVLAAACTAGADDNDTVMWMGPLTISCAEATFQIDPTGGATTYRMGELDEPGEPGNGCVEVPAPELGSFATGTITLGSAGATFPPGVTSCTISGQDYTVTAVGTDADGHAVAQVVAVTPGAQGNQSWEQPTSSDLVCEGVNLGTKSNGDISGGVDGVSEVCYSLYWGQEDLECPPGTPCNKEYWNIAINLDDLDDANLTSCVISTAITASSTTDELQFVNGTLAGPGQTYGYVAIDAALNDRDSVPECFQGPMGSEYAATAYGSSSDVDSGAGFPQLCYSFTQGDASPMPLNNDGADAKMYFHDTNTELPGTYSGRVTDRNTLSLTFADMGAGIGAECGASARNLVEVQWFNIDIGDVRIDLENADVLEGTYTVYLYELIDGSWEFFQMAQSDDEVWGRWDLWELGSEALAIVVEANSGNEVVEDLDFSIHEMPIE